MKLIYFFTCFLAGYIFGYYSHHFRDRTKREQVLCLLAAIWLLILVIYWPFVLR